MKEAAVGELHRGYMAAEIAIDHAAPQNSSTQSFIDGSLRLLHAT
jgi:hypothetical protein